MERSNQDTVPLLSHTVPAKSEGPVESHGRHTDKDHVTRELKSDRVQNHLQNNKHTMKTSNACKTSLHSSPDNCDALPLVESYLRSSPSGTKLRRAFALEDKMAHMNIVDAEEEMDVYLDWVRLDISDSTPQEKEKEERHERRVEKVDVWMRSWKVTLGKRELQEDQEDDPLLLQTSAVIQTRPPQACSLLKRTLRSA
jgi:hypothetical protein